MTVLLEWGPTGAATLASRADVAVVVDVLTFTTTVSVAADCGIRVVPHRWADATATKVAREQNATLAVHRSDAGPGDVSLSPASIRAATGVERVVLPSPNGSTISAVLADAGVEVVAASLRNRRAVGAYLAGRGDVLLVPAGERWPDGSLRPAIEDLWGAGSVVAALENLGGQEVSDEAAAAAAAYRLVEHRIGEALAACASGEELITLGYASDVTIAAELDASAVVPVLADGAFVADDERPIAAAHRAGLPVASPGLARAP